MNLNVSGVGQQGAVVSAGKTQAAATVAREKEAAASAEQDKVTLSGQQTEALTYADPRSKNVKQSELSAMLEESDRRAQSVIDLIRPLVEQQGLNFAKVVSGEQQLKLDPATIDAAKAAIADGGEFSVEKTAERILNFAKAVIGDDPSRFDTIRAAVEKGFEEAKSMLGGALPEISQKTFEAVQAGFDRWKEEGMQAA